jgi:spermidine synthase
MFRVAKHLMRNLTSFSATEEVVYVSESDGVRSLHLGSSTIQSAMRIRNPFELELKYTRGIMCFLLFKTNVKRMLTIGLGGGSVAKYIYNNCLGIVSTIVEINPTVIQMARNQFHVPENDERFEVIEADGLEYLAEHINATDVLLIDAFDSNGIPSNFCSQDFFDQCSVTLKSDGILVINLWGSDKNFDIYLQRIEQSFDQNVLMMRTGKPGNIIVFGFNKAPSNLNVVSLQERAKELASQHSIEFPDFIDRFCNDNQVVQKRLLLRGDTKDI